LTVNTPDVAIIMYTPYATYRMMCCWKLNTYRGSQDCDIKSNWTTSIQRRNQIYFL